MLDYRGGTEQPIRLWLDRQIPMCDGVNLSADIYLPADGERFPTLLLRTIYSNQDPRYLAWTAEFVRAGYAVVLQDCRGRYDSDGDWVPYVCEIDDGYDTHEWIGAQPWCDGNIGTFGVSYPGFTQTAPAARRSRFLKALVPIASQQDNYGHHRVDGVIALSTAQFFVAILRKSLQLEALELIDMPSLHRRLPLISALDDLGDSPFYRGVVEHEAYDEFWSSYSLRDRYGEMEAPAYFMTGWYDSLLHETLKVFNGWRAHARSEPARARTKILIGPWSHQISPWGKVPMGDNGDFAERVFGADAVGDAVSDHLRWYDTRLKGIDTGMDEEAPIKLFVMGANEWRYEQEWPLARTEWTDFFLSPTGSLEPTLALDSGSTTYAYDPKDPCPSWGAQYQGQALSGPRDRRPIEERPDVLVFDTPPLTERMEVTGPVTAILFGSSDCPDTDFTAALVDVAADGAAIILCEGICRARFRYGVDRPALMDAGEIYQFRIDLWATSNLFLPGHQIRLEVSSSNFPRYDRNLNSGGRIGFEGPEAMRESHNTIYFGLASPSRLILPIIGTAPSHGDQVDEDNDREPAARTGEKPPPGAVAKGDPGDQA